MDYTLRFNADDDNALKAALVTRTQFADVTAFLQWHAAEAVAAGRKDLEALAVAEFQRSGVIPTIVEREVEKPVEKAVLVKEVDGVLVAIVGAEADAALVEARR